MIRKEIEEAKSVSMRIEAKFISKSGNFLSMTMATPL